MKKIIATMGAVLAPLSVCHAEERLFPTDILQQGEWDASASVRAESYSYDIRVPWWIGWAQGKRSRDSTEESVRVRYGLGGGFHVGAQIEYASRWVSRSDFLAPPVHTVNRSQEGRQNPSFWLKHGFVNDPANRFSLSGEVRVSPNTTGKQSSSFLAQMSAGWRVDDTLRLYSILSGRIYNDFETADSNSIIIGAHKRVSNNVTLIPQIGHTRWMSTDAFSSAHQNHVGLTLQARLMRNTYLLPQVAVFWNSSAHSKDGAFHQDVSSNGRSIGLTFYHLF
jgi:hypothetical protein